MTYLLGAFLPFIKRTTHLRILVENALVVPKELHRGHDITGSEA